MPSPFPLLMLLALLLTGGCADREEAPVSRRTVRNHPPRNQPVTSTAEVSPDVSEPRPNPFADSCRRRGMEPHPSGLGCVTGYGGRAYDPCETKNCPDGVNAVDE